MHLVRIKKLSQFSVPNIFGFQAQIFFRELYLSARITVCIFRIRNSITFLLFFKQCILPYITYINKSNCGIFTAQVVNLIVVRQFLLCIKLKAISDNQHFLFLALLCLIAKPQQRSSFSLGGFLVYT